MWICTFKTEYGFMHGTQIGHNLVLQVLMTWGNHYDKGKEFLGFKFQELSDSYGIHGQACKNQAANRLTEWVHLTIDDLLWMITFKGLDYCDKDDWITQAIMWLIHTTIPSNHPCSPAQLVFRMYEFLSKDNNWLEND